MGIDQTKDGVFGASKVGANIMTRGYGRYFGLKTGVFRAGCLTGPAHSRTEWHGFLACLEGYQSNTLFPPLSNWVLLRPS